MSAVKTVTVTLGEEQESLERRLASGEYDTADEVLREGLRALDREDDFDVEEVRAMTEEAEKDPRPDVPAAEVFARLEEKQRQRRLKAERAA